MKKRKASYFLLLITIILFIVTNGFAQRPNALKDNSKSGKDSVISRSLPAIGKVIGILRDSSTKEVIEFASVALLRIRDSSAVAGSLTDGKGHFAIDEVPVGKYILRISSIGYRKMDSKPFLLINIYEKTSFNLFPNNQHECRFFWHSIQFWASTKCG